MEKKTNNKKVAKSLLVKVADYIRESIQKDMDNKNNRRARELLKIASRTGMCFALCALTACGSSVGWETKFGVYPITQINDTRGTSPENYEKIQTVKYRMEQTRQ